MITLYHCADARSFRCLWLLEELGLPYELETLGFPPRVEAPEYLRVNPGGTVPWLQDGAVGLCESTAILQYLATRHSQGNLAVTVDDAAYGPWLDWLHFGEATLTTALSTSLRYASLGAPEQRQPAVAEYYRDLFLSRIERVDEALRGNDWLAAGRFTVADISVGYALMLSRFMGLSKSLPAAVQVYWTRLSERPAFKAAKARQKAVAQARGVQA